LLLTAMDEKLKIAIVGIGDVFTRFYFKDNVLKKIVQEQPNCEIYCADKAIKESILEYLKPPFFFVDNKNEHRKRNNKQETFNAWLQEHKFDLIVIATPDKAHISTALEWLDSDFDLMIIEKPFSDDSEKVNELLQNPRYKDETGKPKVAAFSHFRAKVHEQFKDRDSIRAIFKELGELTKFRFFCLEDYSGTDLDFIEEFIRDEREQGNEIDPEINGPIEIPNRQVALNKGMVFDLGSHMLSLLHYFGDPITMEVEKIWAGQYVGLGFDEQTKTKIDGETFAAIEFTFSNDLGNLVEGTAFLGKGIRGIDDPNRFGLNLDKPELGEVKLLEIEGDSGKKLQVFFKRRRLEDREDLARLISSDGIPLDDELLPIARNPIEKYPYFYIFKKAMESPEEYNPYEEDLFINAEEAKSFLVTIEEIRRKIEAGVKKRKDGFPKYKLGKKLSNGEIIPCESLDEIMARFEPIWEKSRF
jgi:hypothetical protein